MRTLPLLLLLCGLLANAEDYKLGPDSLPQPGVPTGTVTKHVLAPGKYYPGTPHNYQVYVPKQYDATKPTPFMIYLDGGGALGNGMRVQTVLDNLIAKKELPPMIGIFIDPGVLPAVSPDVVSRYERVFEYDSLSDRFANFLSNELIPEVSKSWNLSKDPNDRGLSGNSTGAVGAFMAAWNHPDQFRRVLSFIGTYVAMKGAEALPSLIRKTEPKPIRVLLQAGKNDHIAEGLPFGTFYAGSWPVNNQVMFEALSYSGYDVRFDLGTEGHNGKHAGAMMPDALRWLWRGYPAPITVKEPAHMKLPGYDPRGKVYSIVSADQPWEPLASDVTAMAPDANGNIYFSERSSGAIKKLDPTGKISTFKENVQGVNTLRVGPDGRLFASILPTRQILAYAADGVEQTVATNILPGAFTIDKKGGIYSSGNDTRSIVYIHPDGQRDTVYSAGQIAFPVGITLSPDQGMVVVTDVQGRYSWSFQVAKDGKLLNEEPFYRLEMPENGWNSGAFGVTEDLDGQVYFGTLAGIQVCEANGRVAAILNPPDQGLISDLMFGGKEMKALYLVQNSKLYRRPTKVAGTGSWNVVKMPKPPL